MQQLKKYLIEFGLFLFNKKKKEVLGRTWHSWGKIIGFFLILYTVLGGIFAVHLIVFITITPTPGVGIQPRNYGKYGYSNYPNSKIALIALPQVFTYNRADQQAILSEYDIRFIRNLLASANKSGVSSDCLRESDLFGYNLGEPCIFIHIQKVYGWTPMHINESLGGENRLPVDCSFTSSYMAANMTASVGIPLNLTNGDESRSFPFNGQPNFNTSVTAIKLNLTEIPSAPSDPFEGVVTCLVDLEGFGMVRPSSEQLSRLYEIPEDSKTVIRFEM